MQPEETARIISANTAGIAEIRLVPDRVRLADSGVTARDLGLTVDAFNDGLRVAEITVVWAGPHVTQLLGEWGADVIRVEPVDKPQPYTRGMESVPTREQAREEVPAMANDDPESGDQRAGLFGRWFR